MSAPEHGFICFSAGPLTGCGTFEREKKIQIQEFPFSKYCMSGGWLLQTNLDIALRKKKKSKKKKSNPSHKKLALLHHHHLHCGRKCANRGKQKGWLIKFEVQQAGLGRHRPLGCSSPVPVLAVLSMCCKTLQGLSRMTLLHFHWLVCLCNTLSCFWLACHDSALCGGSCPTD